MQVDSIWIRLVVLRDICMYYIMNINLFVVKKQEVWVKFFGVVVYLGKRKSFISYIIIIYFIN